MTLLRNIFYILALIYIAYGLFHLEKDLLHDFLQDVFCKNKYSQLSNPFKSIVIVSDFLFILMGIGLSIFGVASFTFVVWCLIYKV